MRTHARTSASNITACMHACMHCMARIEAINCALARIGTFSIESRQKVASTCVRWTVLTLIGWQPVKVSLTGLR